MIIFDCNGVLVDSEPIVARVASQEFARVGLSVPPAVVARFFAGRRPADMLVDIEIATKKRLPPGFGTRLAQQVLERLRVEVCATAHVEHALTWLRGPKSVASSSPIDRVRTSLEATGLLRFFEPRLFSASQVALGKPAPDLFLHAAQQMNVAPRDCIVVEDSPAGVTAAHAAGMVPIGFIGGTHAADNLGRLLTDAGARAVITDMRMLKTAVMSLRGW